MINITLKSEYSFKKTFGFLKVLHDDYADDNVIGIAEYNTSSFYKLRKLCNDSGKKPVFGYRVTVARDASERVKGSRGKFGSEYIILAKNLKGVKEIFKLTEINSENFFYRANIDKNDIERLSNNVIVISQKPITRRCDYLGVSFSTPVRSYQAKLPLLYINDNFFNDTDGEGVYQCMAGPSSDKKTYPQYILSEREARYYFPKESIDNLKVVVEQIEDFQLEKADNVRHKKEETVLELCIEGAKSRNIDLNDPVYKERFEREIGLLTKKDFLDYLLVVADLLSYTKTFAFVGAGRGSSAGSLVCYLMGIVEIDPIVHGLVFERFVDLNRFDVPDVDSDIPDNARDKVVKYLKKLYGEKHVRTISTISTFKPKVSIGDFAKHMQIPRFETEAVKDIIIEHSGGDARASFCLEDTFKGTEVGREFIEKFPQMLCVSKIEGHAKQKGKHAAGVIVCNKELTQYCGVDVRDDTVYLDKRDAEDLNLLKIDILGLRTLTVLQEYAHLIGMDYKDFYTLPLDDPETYKVFAERRMAGIFQFDGDAMASINDSIPMENFDDIAACAALGRPGSLSSGGTSRYIQLRRGERQVEYYCPLHEKISKSTFGIVIFQETMMEILKQIGDLTWEDVSTLRRAASKSYGDEFFDKFKAKFVAGATRKHGYSVDKAEKVWLDVSSMGSYSFNKSHSVAYGLVSYWCAFAKAKNPLEFMAANLNHAKDDESSLKLLREFYESDGINYTPVDPDKSGKFWSIVNGELLGGLTNIIGVGTGKALDIIKIRKGKKNLTPGILKLMENPKTPFDILYPINHHFGDLYKNPLKYGLENLMEIRNVEEGQGRCSVIGKMIVNDEVDLNDVQSIAKRGGEIIEGVHMKVHVRLEDDSGTLMCIVGRFQYERLSQAFLRAKTGKTYFAIIGDVRKGAKILYVKQVANLNDQIGLNETEEQR